MRIDRGNWPEHRRWIVVVVVMTIVAAAGYGVEAVRLGRLPGGSSVSGFGYGVVGGLIIVFEMLLWPRKALRRFRLGRTKHWMAAHVWLGLLSLPLIVLHSGFHFSGGALALVLLVLFVSVIASGVWGLLAQQVLPEAMLHEVPAETIHAQIDTAIARLRGEAERLTRLVCGDPVEDDDAAVPATVTGRGDSLIVGAVRSVGKVQGFVAETRARIVAVPGSDALRTAFRGWIGPFLEVEYRADSPLAAPQRAGAMFRELKARLPESAHYAADLLADLCDQRRQLARQRVLQARLNGWILFHLPLSTAMVTLMVIHIVMALRYL